MPSQIKAVVFDHGGVLTEGGGKGTNERAIGSGLGVHTTLEIADLLEGLKRGRITNAQFMEGVNNRYPDAPKRLSNQIWNEVYASLRPIPQSYEFVRQCRESGLPVGLLSNINPVISERLYADGSYDGFDSVVLSCFVGFAKPDPEIYAAVERDFPGVKTDEILLLDDQQKCVIGALNRGWQALKVTSSGQMIQEAGRLLHFG